MTEAQIKKPQIKYTKLFINGEFVDSVKKQTIPVYNPCTSEKVCEISAGTAEDVHIAVKAAQKAFEEWKDMPAEDRTALFFKLAQKVEEHIDELTSLEALDTGTAPGEVRFNIEEVIVGIRYFGGWADKSSGKTFSGHKDMHIQSVRVPYGVCGLINPWNYPLLMAAWKFMPALAAGNAVVCKPSEETPLSILYFAWIFSQIKEFPKGLFNVVCGYGHEAGDAISKHPDIKKCSFTGSTPIGREVLSNSAKSNLKKVHLELGGKAPVIIFDDADIAEAAEQVWIAGFSNVGQNCCQGTRILLQEGIYNKFLQELSVWEKKCIIGDPFENPKANLGPLITKKQFEKVLGFLEHAKKVENLKILFGGNRHGEKGQFIQPTVFIEVPDDSKLVKEEIFGPIITILKPFKTLEEAQKRANDTEYGLACGIFTPDMNKFEKLANNLVFGNVWINTYNITPWHTPFGGLKQSGFGRDNSEEGFLEYTTLKSVYQAF